MLDDAPKKLAASILSRAKTSFPRLTGVIEAPIMLPDGSILTKPGYDPDSGLYLSPLPGIEWLPVKDKPTKADIAEAVQTLREPFAEFPYVTEADLAVMISAILTGIQRRLLFSAPLHAFDASKQGYGKTLQADCASLLVTGRTTAAFSVSADEEEIRKKVTSALLAGDSIMLLDNIEAPIKSPSLCTILTVAEYTDRLLVTMKKPVMATNVLFLASGNNLVFAGDMSSRVIISRINDPNVEEPEKRNFKIKDLRAYILENRPQLVHAAHIVLRDHYIAGRPNDLPQCRFQQWSDEIRAALVWAGFADPCITQDRIVRANPMLTAQRRIFNSWFDVIGADRMVSSRTLVEKTGFTLGESEKEKEQRTQLKEALLEVASDGGFFTCVFCVVCVHRRCCHERRERPRLESRTCAGARILRSGMAATGVAPEIQGHQSQRLARG